MVDVGGGGGIVVVAGGGGGGWSTLVVVVVDMWWSWVVVMGDGERWGGEQGLRENLNCFDYESRFVIKTVQIFSKSPRSLQ